MTNDRYHKTKPNKAQQPHQQWHPSLPKPVVQLNRKNTLNIFKTDVTRIFNQKPFQIINIFRIHSAFNLRTLCLYIQFICNISKSKPEWEWANPNVFSCLHKHLTLPVICIRMWVIIEIFLCRFEIWISVLIVFILTIFIIRMFFLTQTREKRWILYNFFFFFSKRAPQRAPRRASYTKILAWNTWFWPTSLLLHHQLSPGSLSRWVCSPI